jgi:leucine dehydrogenase
MKQSEVESHPDFDQHELVTSIQSDSLTALIAVHNTQLGPGAGGCRMFPYASEAEALTDVLRLSRGMTYKSALAGLPFGGGKSVIIGDPRKDKTRELLLAMGDFVESLDGRYMTAEDSGTSVADMAIIGERTRHVSGFVAGEKGGGDPSPTTAYGCFIGIREAVLHRCSTGLSDVHVAIQGVGNVGFHLARLLVAAGAKVSVADVSEANIQRAVEALPVTIVSPDEILSTEADVLAPCALGGALNRDSVQKIRAGIVAGAANNQLSQPEIGGSLIDRGILYAPDYVINAGGIIDVYYQCRDERSEQVVRQHVDRIGTTLKAIFKASDLRRVPTNKVADEMAEAIFRNGLSHKDSDQKRSGKAAA